MHVNPRFVRHVLLPAASMRYAYPFRETTMSEFSEETPMTFGMLLEALDGCGQAVGFALAGALNTAGTDRSRVLSIAESLQTLSVDGRFPGPAGHCMGGIVHGMQSFLLAGENDEGAPLL
jgi:hypothetical protein